MTIAMDTNNTFPPWVSMATPLPEPVRFSQPFNTQGAFDVLLPYLLVLQLLALGYQQLERWYSNCPGKVSYISFITFISRASLCSLYLTLLVPSHHFMSRWDWLVYTPTIWESLAFLWQWNDTHTGFKIHIYAHHILVLLSWPTLR